LTCVPQAHVPTVVTASVSAAASISKIVRALARDGDDCQAHA
jgi:hypothetical protein